MTKAKTNDKLAKSIEHANFVLKSAGAPLKAKELNTVLESHGYAPLNPTTLAREFKAIPVKGNSKVKFAYTVKSPTKACTKSECKKGNKKPCKKPTKKACKKSIPQAKSCSGTDCKCDETRELCTVLSKFGNQTVGSLTVLAKGHVNVHKYNRSVLLNNLLAECPAAENHPEEFVIMAGGRDWPEFYEGIPVIANPKDGTAGALLVHKKYIAN